MVSFSSTKCVNKRDRGYKVSSLIYNQKNTVLLNKITRQVANVQKCTIKGYSFFRLIVYAHYFVISFNSICPLFCDLFQFYMLTSKVVVIVFHCLDKETLGNKTLKIGSLLNLSRTASPAPFPNTKIVVYEPLE